MKNLFCVFLVFLSAIKLCWSITLSENSTAKMQIVLSDTPTIVERTSAKELKEHLDLICKTNFEIVLNSQRDNSQRAIFVGDFKQTKEILNCQNFNTLGYDSIKIKTTPNGDIALCGHPQRGTLYAVYTLLEDFIGVRWWSANERYLPNNPTLKISSIDVSYTPKFMLREALYRIAFDGVFASRLKQNGATLTKMNFNRPVISKEYGGCNNLVLFKGRGSSFHAHYEIIPPEKYFKTNPQWFSLVNGKRTCELAQLCLTNKEMTQQYVENVKKLLRENPQATSIQVSQNDWQKPCECKNCKAIDDENQSHAGTNIYFANKIAQAIEKEFPNVFIDTFAYQYTRKAPTKIRPHKNVLVRLCTIECEFSKPLEDASVKENKAFVDDIKQWAKLTNNLFIWDYTTCFRSYMIPHPNMRVLAPNIRFFANNSVSGLFEQGDAFCNSGDFVLLRNWVISHLMWNPQLDENTLFKEFLYGYYGKEVGSIFEEYIKVIHDCSDSKKIYVGCFSDELLWLDTDTYNKANALIQKANQTAQQLEKTYPQKYAGLVKKVRRESLSFQHMSVVYYKQLKLKAIKEAKHINLPENPKKLVEYLISTWKELNVETWREFTTPEQFATYQKHLLNDVEKAQFLITLPQVKQNNNYKLLFTTANFIKLDIKNKYFGSPDIVKDENSELSYSAIIPQSENKQILRIIFNVSQIDFSKQDNITLDFFANMRTTASDAPAKSFVSANITTSRWVPKAKIKIPLSRISKNSLKNIKLFSINLSKNDGTIFIDWRANVTSNNEVYIDEIFALPSLTKK